MSSALPHSPNLIPAPSIAFIAHTNLKSGSEHCESNTVMAGNGEGDTTCKSGSPIAAVATKGSGQKSFTRMLLSAFSRVGHLIFRSSNHDLEKRLKYLSKEEEAVHKRLMQRSQAWRKLARALTLYSVILELLFLGIGIITTRSPELSWQRRALRILPVFAFPALAALLYSACAKYYRMRERKDQKTLELLRAERQAKIDELKERTNYYLTQQLIQRYDTDPAAKAAAASVLVSKLGTEAGIKVAFESFNLDTDKQPNKNDETEVAASMGVRRRIHHQQTQSSPERLSEVDQSQGRSNITGKGGDIWVQGVEVEHYKGKGSDGGWVARLAAMLVGEDLTQCYALICGKCHMHNGLARKEDFPYVTYFCPHCHALNGSKQLSGEASREADGASPRFAGSVDNPNGATNVSDAPVCNTNAALAHGAHKAELKVD